MRGLLFALVFAWWLPATGAVPERPRSIALVTPASLPAPARHGLERLHAALAARGFHVVDGEAASPADSYVLLGIDPRGGCAESLSILRTTYRGRPAVDLRGGDAVGLMYAALDTAERIGSSGG